MLDKKDIIELRDSIFNLLDKQFIVAEARDILYQLVANLNMVLTNSELQTEIGYVQRLRIAYTHLSAIKHFINLVFGNEVRYAQIQQDIEAINLSIQPKIPEEKSKKEISNTYPHNNSAIAINHDDHVKEKNMLEEQTSLYTIKDNQNNELFRKKMLLDIWKMVLGENSYYSKKVFISYAWPLTNEDNQLDEKWTKDFIQNIAKDLAYAGMQVYLDEFQSGAGYDLQAHMKRISTVDHILFFSSRTMDHKLAWPKSGVKYEYDLIKQELEKNPHRKSQRYIIPVLLNGINYCPEEFKSLAEVSFFKDGYLKSIQSLIKHIYGLGFDFGNDWGNAVQSIENAQLRMPLQEKYLANNTIQALYGEPFPFDNSYINLQMICNDQDKIIKKTSIDSREEIPGGKKPIQIKDLFLTQVADQINPSLIYVYGRAGIGKSTFANYISYQWSQKKLWPELDWIFTLKFRDIPSTFDDKTDYSISHWVYTTHFKAQIKPIDENTFNKKIWEHLIESRPDKILFILDGLDEAPSNHQYEAALKVLIENQKFRIIITSRPHGLGLEQLPEKARKIEIIGFRDEDVGNYVANYFSQSPHVVPKIISEIKNNPALWGNVHIPVSANIICGIFENNFGKSIAKRSFGTMVSLYQEMEFSLFWRAYKDKASTENLNRIEIRKKLNDAYSKTKEYLIEIAQIGFNDEKLIFDHSQITTLIPQEERDFHIKTLLELGLLKSDKKKTVRRNLLEQDNDETHYEFLHLTFQEYYIALSWAQKIRDAKDDADPTLLELHTLKFNPRYQVVFWFIAGLLNDHPPAFNRLMLIIDDANHGDMLGHVKLDMQLHCVHEGWDAANTTGWLSKISNKIAEQMRIVSTPYPQWLYSLKYTPRWHNENLFSKINGCINDEDTMRFADFIATLKREIDILVVPDIIVTKLDAMLNNLTWNQHLIDVIKNLNIELRLKNLPVYIRNHINTQVIEFERTHSYALEKFTNISGEIKSLKPLKLSADADTIKILVALLKQSPGERNQQKLNESCKSDHALSIISALDTASITNSNFFDNIVELLPNANINDLLPEAFCPSYILSIITTFYALGKNLTFINKIKELLYYNKNEYTQIIAAEILRILQVENAHEYTLPILIKLITVYSPDVKYQACNAITNWGVIATQDPSNIEKLIDLLDYLGKTRNMASDVITRLKPTTLTPTSHAKLLKLLINNNSEIRETAISVMRGLPFPAIKRMLNEVLNLCTNQDPQIRLTALKVIDIIPPAEITQDINATLKKCLLDDNKDVCIKALQTVGRLGLVIKTDSDLIKILTSLLQKPDIDIDIQKNVLATMHSLQIPKLRPEILAQIFQAAKIGDERTIKIISLTKPKVMTEEIYRHLECYIEALTSKAKCRIAHGYKDKVSMVLDIVQNLKQTNAHVWSILALLLSRWHMEYVISPSIHAIEKTALPTPEFQKTVFELLCHKNRIIRKNCIEAIKILGPRLATEEILLRLSQLLFDKGTNVEVLRAISAIGEKAATPEILAGLARLLREGQQHWAWADGPLMAIRQPIEALGSKAVTPELLNSLLVTLDQTLNQFQINVIVEIIKAIGEPATQVAEKLLHNLVKTLDEYGSYEHKGKCAIASIKALCIKMPTLIFILLNINKEQIRVYDILNIIESLPAAQLLEISKNHEFSSHLIQLLQAGELNEKRYTLYIVMHIVTHGIPLSAELLGHLMQLLQGNDADIKIKTLRIINLLNADTYKTAMQVSIKQLLNDNLEVFDSNTMTEFRSILVTPEIFALIGDLLGAKINSLRQFSKIATLTIQFCKNLTPDKTISESEGKKILLTLLVGSYYAQNISAGIIWEAKRQSWAWHGFIDKTPFTLYLSAQQAAWLLNVTPIVIARLAHKQWKEINDGDNTLAQKLLLTQLSYEPLQNLNSITVATTQTVGFFKAMQNKK